MKLTESEIEKLLRQAPRPAAPAGLKAKLTGHIQLPKTPPTAPQSETTFRPPSWWRRWWPALAPAGASVAFAAMIAVQHNEITTLKREIQTLQTAIEAATNRVATPPPPAAPPESAAASSEAEEIARLKQRVALLNQEIGPLEGLQQANTQLREQLNTTTGLSQPELDALAEAKARGQRIACVNNLKQIGLAVRIYAGDNNLANPPDFLTMSNELSTPKILFCPANTNLTSVKTWTEFANTRSSYEYLAAGETNVDGDPTRILTRCAIHNNIGLCDGSVQMISKERAADSIVERDGKLYLELQPRPATKP